MFELRNGVSRKWFSARVSEHSGFRRKVSEGGVRSVVGSAKTLRQNLAPCRASPFARKEGVRADGAGSKIGIYHQ